MCEVQQLVSGFNATQSYIINGYYFAAADEAVSVRVGTNRIFFSPGADPGLEWIYFETTPFQVSGQQTITLRANTYGPVWNQMGIVGWSNITMTPAT